MGSEFRRVGEYHFCKFAESFLDRKYHDYIVTVQEFEGESTVQDSPCTGQLMSTTRHETDLQSSFLKFHLHGLHWELVGRDLQ